MTTPRSRVMAVLTVVAMLGIGIAGGIALDRTVLHRNEGQWRGGRGGGRGRGAGPFGIITEPVDTASRNRMRARIVKRITDELALSAAQTTAIDAIFVRQEQQLDAIREKVGPQLDSVRTAMRASMDSVLTAEQRARFDEARKRWRQRRGSADGRARRDSAGT